MLTFNDKSIFDCSKEELNQAGDQLKRAWSVLQQKATASFYIGQRVKFTSTKGHGVISGKITKINQKSVTITTDDLANWRVSSSMLEPENA